MYYTDPASIFALQKSLADENIYSIICYDIRYRSYYERLQLIRGKEQG